jgi:hypothetical protein
LHIGHGSRRNPDIWQVFQGEKCKKKIDFDRKVQKRVIFRTLSNAASFIAFGRESALEAISSKMTALFCRLVRLDTVYLVFDRRGRSSLPCHFETAATTPGILGDLLWRLGIDALAISDRFSTWCPVLEIRASH